MSSRIVAPSTGPMQELRAIRWYLGLSQRCFAGHLGVTGRSLSRWERGAKPVPLTVLRLARFLALWSTPLAQFLPAVSDADRPAITLNSGSECFRSGVDCRGRWYTMDAPLSRRRSLGVRTCTVHLRHAYELMVTALTDPRVKHRPWRRRDTHRSKGNTS